MGLIFHYFGSYLDALSSRMGGIVEDEGSGRIDIYKITLAGISQGNALDLLVGHGCNSILDLNIPNAHNDLLQMMYEYGIVGVIFYVVLLVDRFRQIARFRKMENGMYMAYLSSFYIFFFLGIFSNLVPLMSYFVFSTLLWGFLEGNYIRERRENA